MEEILQEIRSRYPSCKGRADMIEALAREVADLPLSEFFEPTSVIQQAGTKSKLIGTSAANVKAWMLHMAYSTRLRLRSLEAAILREIGEGEIVPAMVLARSHMEVAGLAVLCNDTLYDVQRKGERGKVEELMLKTIIGTAMRRLAKHDQATEESLLLSEQATIFITDAINALDTFRESGMHCRRTYALLCEYAHPNPRTNMEFYSASGQAAEGGWRVSYHRSSAFREEHVRMVLTIVTDNARAGYAASEILRLTEVCDTSKGLSVRLPDDDAFARIWTTLMRMPVKDESRAAFGDR